VCPCRSYLFEQDLILFFALCLGSSSMPKVFCCPPPDFSCARDFHFLLDFLSALFHVPKLVLSQFLSSSLGASFSLRYGTNFWSNCWVCSSDLFFSPALCSSFLNPAVMVSVKLSALEISCLVFSIYVPAVHFLKRQDFAVSVLGSVQIFPVSFFLLAARTWRFAARDWWPVRFRVSCKRSVSRSRTPVHSRQRSLSVCFPHSRSRARQQGTTASICLYRRPVQPGELVPFPSEVHAFVTGLCLISRAHPLPFQVSVSASITTQAIWFSDLVKIIAVLSSGGWPGVACYGRRHTEPDQNPYCSVTVAYYSGTVV
jgi:hypothetical protein